MTVHCVYWVRHADHTDLMTQGYIGVTAYFDRRMKEHCKRTENRYFRLAIQKYGWGDLVKEQILIADEDYCLDIEAKLRPKDKIGWNLTKGGGKPPVAIGNKYKLGISSWNKGVTPSDETRVKISKSVAKLWDDPEHKKRMSAALKGRVSPRKGVKLSPETIAKLVASKIGKPSKKKGIPMTAEQRDAMVNRVRSEVWSCPHCDKSGFSLGAKNRWHFDKCKQKPTIMEIV